MCRDESHTVSCKSCLRYFLRVAYFCACSSPRVKQRTLLHSVLTPLAFPQLTQLIERLGGCEEPSVMRMWRRELLLPTPHSHQEIKQTHHHELGKATDFPGHTGTSEKILGMSRDSPGNRTGDVWKGKFCLRKYKRKIEGQEPVRTRYV